LFTQPRTRPRDHNSPNVKLVLDLGHDGFPAPRSLVGLAVSIWYRRRRDSWLLYRRAAALVELGEDGVAGELRRLGAQLVVERRDELVLEQVIISVRAKSCLLAYA
jgi:hypothetical protein